MCGLAARSGACLSARSCTAAFALVRSAAAFYFAYGIAGKPGWRNSTGLVALQEKSYSRQADGIVMNKPQRRVLSAPAEYGYSCDSLTSGVKLSHLIKGSGLGPGRTTRCG
jgi:hypothetical protein